MNRYTIILLLILSCSIKKQNTIIPKWNRTAICYTVPKYFVKGMTFESEVTFRHFLKIQNTSKDSLRINFNNSVFYGEYMGEQRALQLAKQYGVVTMGPRDSLFLYLKSLDEFSVLYNPDTKEKDVYNRSDEIIKETKIKAELDLVSRKQAIEFIKEKDFYTFEQFSN